MDCSLSEGPSRYLDALYEEYDRFDVQQTTIGADTDEFDAIDDRPEGIMIRVKIDGSKGVLAVPDGENWTLPGGVVDTDLDRNAVATVIEQWTGVTCEVDGLDRVSLVCLQCTEKDDELWTLSALFSATPVSGTPTEGVVWRDRATSVPISPLP